MSVSVLVVSADPLARGGLVGMLGRRPGLTLAGEQSAAALELLAAPPDVILWDLGASGRVEPGAILESGIPVLALATDATRAAEAMELGVTGILFRDGDAGRMDAALQAIALGLTVLDEPFREALLRAELEPAGGRADLRGEELTPREREVLGLLAQGLSNRALGRRLGISENTARFHVNAILAKLGARSRTDAVVRAARAGLVMI